MLITPYLIFQGNCADAFRFYQQVLGGELGMMTNAQSPMSNQVPAGRENDVMHAMLKVDGQELMGSDAPLERFDRPQGFSVTLQVKDPAEAGRIFNALAEGGTVTMALQNTFWSPAFGMLKDRFGTPWMVSAAGGTQSHAQS